MGEIKFNIPINFNSTLMENKKKEKLLKLKTEQKIYFEFWEEKKAIPKCGFQFIEQYCNKYIIFIIDKAYNGEKPAIDIFFDADFQVGMYYIHKELSDDYIIKFNSLYINKIIDMNNGGEYNERLDSLLTKNATIINRVKTNMIMSLGNDEFDSMWYVANRYYSFNNRNGIIMLTRALQRARVSIMTEQMIVNIYSKLCSDHMTDLWCGVMQDRIEKDQFYSESEAYIYSNVSIALLEIMEKAVNSYDMENILKTYIYELNKKKIKGRFYLGSINSADYPRINTVLDILREQGLEFR